MTGCWSASLHGVSGLVWDSSNTLQSVAHVLHVLHLQLAGDGLWKLTMAECLTRLSQSQGSLFDGQLSHN